MNDGDDGEVELGPAPRFSPFPFTLRQVQYALAVLRCGGSRRAADACGVSQPALSAQVAQLEDSLGVALIERDRRGVRANVAARPLLERMQELLVEAADLEELARRGVDALGGVLRLGVIPTIAPYLLPDLTRVVQVNHPELTILWTEGQTAPPLLGAEPGRAGRRRPRARSRCR